MRQCHGHCRDGAAIGYPCAICFLAHAANLQRKLTAATWVNVALGSSLGSAGAAPVPNAGELTAYNTARTVVISPYHSSPYYVPSRVSINELRGDVVMLQVW
jgi:Na+/H+-dicarboxylate symporter